MAKHAFRTLAALVLLVALFAATPGEAAREPATEHWVSVQLAGGTGAGASLDARGYRQFPAPPGMTAEAYSAWLEAHPDVLHAAPDATVTAAGAPNDYYYSTQGNYLEPLGIEDAWDITNDASEIVVAVLDTGIDFRHRDLVRNLWQNPNDADNDGVDDDNNGCIDDQYGCRFLRVTPKRITECGYAPGPNPPTGDIRDDHGAGAFKGSHGTGVAGVIGARGNNLTGVTGVAWRIRLMTLKVLDCGPNGDSPTGEMANVAKAIDYARRMGADIINLSFASGPGDPNADIPALRAAIEAALADGLIIVAAAGNHGARGVGFPAAYAQYPNVIGVGASDPNAGNAWASYSSFGGGVDLAAPGRVASTIRSDLNATPYAWLGTGTSSAAPIVTGALALMMARNPDLAMEEYIAILQETASAAPPAPHEGNWAGAGVVNIGRALDALPMTLSGEALREWTSPPEGTLVRALVNGVECGSTETETVNARARYSLRVAPASVVTGCGAPGRDVEIRVGGLPLADPVPWGALNESLARANFGLNGVEPPPGPILIQDLSEGWSQIAYLGPTAPLPDAASSFPEGWKAIALWDAEAGGGGAFRLYFRDAPAQTQTLTELRQYDAFWIYGSTGSVVNLTPDPPPSRQVTLAEGWNAIVYTGEAGAVADALASIDGLYDQALRYDNATRRWRSYLPDSAAALNDFGGLYPFRLYWIHMIAPATLIME